MGESKVWGRKIHGTHQTNRNRLREGRWERRGLPIRLGIVSSEAQNLPYCVGVSDKTDDGGVENIKVPTGKDDAVGNRQKDHVDTEDEKSQ